MSTSDIHTITGTDGEQKLAKVCTHTKADGSSFISIKLADDNAAGLGSRTKSGGRLISPFDLYAHFKHRGDVIAAVKSLNNKGAA